MVEATGTSKMIHHTHRLGLLEITHYGTSEAIEKTAKRLSAEQAVTLTKTEKAAPRGATAIPRVEFDAQVSIAHDIYARFKDSKGGYESSILEISKTLNCSRNRSKELITECRTKFYHKTQSRMY